MVIVLAVVMTMLVVRRAYTPPREGARRCLGNSPRAGLGRPSLGGFFTASAFLTPKSAAPSSRSSCSVVETLLQGAIPGTDASGCRRAAISLASAFEGDEPALHEEAAALVRAAWQRKVVSVLVESRHIRA